MTKMILITLALIGTFALGFALSTILQRTRGDGSSTARVTGIGGIFFKCKDPKAVSEWYRVHLGLNTNDYGAVFEWRQGADTAKKGFTQWSPFAETTKYFEPSAREFMINYRVNNLQALVEQLKKKNVTITDAIETYDYGKFVHILDLEGNKVELWEANDVEYEKMGQQMGSQTTK